MAASSPASHRPLEGVDDMHHHICGPPAPDPCLCPSKPWVSRSTHYATARARPVDAASLVHIPLLCQPLLPERRMLAAVALGPTVRPSPNMCSLQWGG